MEDLENPIDDPHQPTVTEELLQIIEEFADYIDKFMFEIVTFLAVVDSSMGLVKDVLGVFGFSGWKMTFFPSFSFAVTIGVFLFGTNKRKGKRKAEAAQLEGLGEAMEMIDDVFEVMDDVMDEIEEVEGEAGALGLGDYSISEDDDDDDNGDQNALCKDENNIVDETSEMDDAVGKIDVVEVENNQDTSAQQDVKTEVEPPKSTIQKVIGIAVIAARIASKLTKKKQQDQEEMQPEENTSNLERKANGCGTGSDIGDESLTGTNGPPTDDKSKQEKDTRNQSAFGGLSLGEDGDELKNEAFGLVEAAKEDSIKTAELVKVGSLGAGSVVQGSTKQVLTSTGALKVGHGLYREADFITGHLNKEGKALAKSLEKDTVEKTKQIKENEIIKASGVEKAGTAVSREATFIAGSLNQEAKKAFHYGEEGESGVKRHSSISDSKVTDDKRSLSLSQRGRDEATRPKTGNVRQSLKELSPAEDTGQERENKQKINTVSVTDISKQQQLQVRGPEKKLSYEAHPKNVQQNIQNTSKLDDICEEKQAIEKGRKEEKKEKCKSQGNQEIITPHEFVPEDTTVKGGKKETKQSCESQEIQDPERLIPEPVSEIPNMASNVMEGAPAAAVGEGAATAASQAKQGLHQTGKKSKGLLQIAMRLVRLIMRVAKRGNSAASSQSSSRRDSTASGTGSLGGAPAKGKRSAGEEGGVPDIAGAASSMAMGSGGPKGGKIGAIVGIVMRLVRLASKLKGGGQQGPSNSDLRSSKESIELESDSEFYDCDEEFPTQEIQTQTEDRLSLLSVATQTTQTDPGSTWTMNACDSGKLTDMQSDVRKKDLRTYADAFQTALGRGEVSTLGTRGQKDTYQGHSKEISSHEQTIQAAPGQGNNFSENQTRQLRNMVQRRSESKENNQTLLSREEGTNVKELNDSEKTTRRNSTGSSQRITLKILSPNIDSYSAEATNNSDLNSVLLDIDAPVVLHSTRDFRPLPNDVNVVANGNNVVSNRNPQINEKQTSKEHEGRKTPQRDFPKDGFSVRQSNLQKASSVDLGELEKQTSQSRSLPLRDSHTYGRNSSEGTCDTCLSRPGIIVPYSSSSEDLDDSAPFLQRRRPVVRFEDECQYSYLYDEDKPIASYREKKKRNVLSRIKTQQEKQSRLGSFEKYSSLENLDNRFPKDRYKKDDDTSIFRDSGCDQESTRLLSEYEKPLMESSDVFAARKSRLSGSRTSYFGDDESDQHGALC